MNDGRTRKVEAAGHQEFSFLTTHRATLTLMNGEAAGEEWALEGTRAIAGRSEKAAIQLDDGSVSTEHAAFELGQAGFGVRDLASTNGLRVNGTITLGAALEHGDRIHLGFCELQYVVEEKTAGPRVWSVEEDD